MLFCKNFVGIHAQFSARRHVYSHALGVVPFCFAIAIEHSILLCPSFNFSGRAHSVQRMVPFYRLLRAVRVRVGQGWARIKRTSIRGQPSGGASVHGGRKLVAGLWGLVHWGIAGRREPFRGDGCQVQEVGLPCCPFSLKQEAPPRFLSELSASGQLPWVRPCSACRRRDRVGSLVCASPDAVRER